MANMFSQAWQVLVAVFWAGCGLIDHVDLMNPRPKARRTAPLPQPVVVQPSVAVAVVRQEPPLAALVVVEKAVEGPPQIVVFEEQPPVVEEIVDQVVAERTEPVFVPEVPMKTWSDCQAEVKEDFDAYIDALGHGDYDLAKELREGFASFLQGKPKIFFLNQLLKNGKLDDCAENRAYEWKNEDGVFEKRNCLSEVPSNKQALSLLWALFNEAFPASPRREVVTKSFAARSYGGASAPTVMRPGKTARDKAKVKGPKPERVGPAKGKNPTPPKHGRGKKK